VGRSQKQFRPKSRAFSPKPRDSYNALKVGFSATLGEEPEIEGVLV
jgi:hypothetical protein